MIQKAESYRKPLYLLDALVSLNFISDACPFIEDMRHSKSNIDLVNHDYSSIVQENVFKVCCSVLNLRPQ